MRPIHLAAMALGLTAVGASRAMALDPSLPVVEHELPNGLKLLVLEDPAIPNAALYVGWRVGSRNEVPGITGLAHFFEHMMFSGGARYGGKFDPIMEAAGGANNAYTTQDCTVYQDWFPASALPLILDMEADRMRAMQFKEAVVETERGVVASERRLNMEEPAEVMREQLWATAYAAHPYQWSVLGHMVDIQNWRKEDLEQFFRTNYAPNNAVMVIVGAVKADQVLALVKEKFGSIPRGPERRPIHTQEPPQRGERRVVVEDPHATLKQVMAAWHICETSHPDFPVIEVLERLLLHGESSRLHQLLVEDERVCLDVGGGFQGYQFDASLFAVELTIREGQEPAKAEALLYQALSKLAAEGPTDRELEKAKNGLEAGVVRALKTINGKASLLVDAELFFGGWKKIGAVLAGLRAVTKDDVKRVASKTFTARNRTVVSLEVPTDGAAGEASPDAEGDEGEEPEVAEGEGAEGDPGAEGEKPAPPAPAVELPKIKATVALPKTIDSTLGNGLRLVLVPDKRLPIVTYLARVQGGAIEDPAGKEGAASLLATLLGKGAGERDAAAFQEAVDFVGGSFGTAASQRWLDVQAEFLAKDKDLGLELLSDVLVRPRLDAGEVDKQRGLAVDALAAARDEPSQVIGLYFGAFTLQGHPFARPACGDERSVGRLTRDDVTAAAKRLLTPGRTWLAIAGDFDPVEMKKKVEARLGGWKGEASQPAPLAAPKAQPKDRVLLVDKPGSLQTYFALGGMAFDWTDPDYTARRLANTVLGGRFTSRLNQALRIESGLTYGAGSRVDDARKGLFTISTYTATKTSKEAIELALSVYRKFTAEGITQAELDSARTYIQGQYAPDAVQTPDQVAELVLSLDSEGLPRDLVDGYFPRLDALTLEQVNRVIKTRFPRTGLSWVVIGQAEALRDVVKPLGELTEVPLKAPGFGPGF